MNKGLKQLFPRLSAYKLDKLTETYNIKIPENFMFSNVNIVIGPNGSGKTRFLNMIKDAYKYTNCNNIVYGYFPAISDKKTFEHDYEETDYTLFDTLSDPQASFDDFLNAIETYSDDFIIDLLQYLEHRGKVQKSRSKKALDTIINWFYDLTNKKIKIDNGNIVVMNNDNIIETLDEALKFFSPGELILFYISIFIALQNNNRKNKIIILDEPECHLHPQVLIKFVKHICSRNDYTKIWIATHSLFIIPEFDFENIVFIKDNAIISRRSNMYGLLLSEMTGTYNKNVEFFSSLTQWQFCNYIAECFQNPNVIDNVNPYDEQVQLFVQHLKHNSIRSILDFGGGSARLGLSLKSLLGNSFSSNYEYSIYDPTPSYKGNEFEIYNKLTDITKKYDCVVMMNVLHEIPPSDWVKTFKSVYNVLNNNGFLIFVETSILSKGELPNSTGYLVLSNDELKVLFNQPSHFANINITDKQKSICTVIPKNALINISEKTIIEAIKVLEENSLNKIKFLRQVESNENNIRKYAFYSQLYINAKLFNDTNHTTKQNKKEPLKKITKSHINQNIISFSKERLLSLQQNTRYEYSYTIKQKRLIMECCDYALKIIGFYEENISIPTEYMEFIWTNIIMLEKNHISPEIIATFLAINAFLGHKKSESRLENQYLNHLILHINNN